MLEGGGMGYEPKLFLSVPEAARELHTKPETLREWASRDADPFPIMVLPWNRRNGIVEVESMLVWFHRNAVQAGKERHA